MTATRGGIETYIYNLADEMKESVRFDFLTHFHDMVFAEEMKARGSKVYYIPGKSKGIVKHLRALGSFLKKHKEYDVIYINIMDPMVFPTVWMMRLFGRKCVVHSHNGDVMKKLPERVCRVFLNMGTSRRMACSENAAEYMFGKKKAKSTVIIHNKIDTDRFVYDEKVRNAKREELGIMDEFVLCHVGRLTWQKNPLGVIDILAETVKSDQNIVLLSAGVGDLESETKEYAKQKGVDKYIRFLGARTDVNELMQAADVFLLPSFYEGLPIVGVEAQASGLPCFFSDQITRETDITGNVKFLPLGEHGRWAEEILACRGKNRENYRRQVEENGYDLKHPSDKMIISECFK